MIMSYTTLVKEIVEDLLTEGPKVNLGASGAVPFTTNARVAASGGADAEGRPYVNRMVRDAREIARKEGIPRADTIRAYASDSAFAYNSPNTNQHIIGVPTTTHITGAVIQNYPEVPFEDTMKGIVAHELGHTINADTVDTGAMLMKKLMPSSAFGYESNAHDTGERLMKHSDVPFKPPVNIQRDLGLASYAGLIPSAALKLSGTDVDMIAPHLGLVPEHLKDAKRLSRKLNTDFRFVKALSNMRRDATKLGSPSIIRDGKIVKAKDI
jgi:hypothetical protein